MASMFPHPAQVALATLSSSNIHLAGGDQTLQLPFSSWYHVTRKSIKILTNEEHFSAALGSMAHCRKKSLSSGWSVVVLSPKAQSFVDGSHDDKLSSLESSTRI